MLYQLPGKLIFMWMFVFYLKGTCVWFEVWITEVSHMGTTCDWSPMKTQTSWLRWASLVDITSHVLSYIIIGRILFAPVQLYREVTPGSSCTINPALYHYVLYPFADFDLYSILVMNCTRIMTASQSCESFWGIIEPEGNLGDPLQNLPNLSALKLERFSFCSHDMSFVSELKGRSLLHVILR